MAAIEQDAAEEVLDVEEEHQCVFKQPRHLYSSAIITFTCCDLAKYAERAAVFVGGEHVADPDEARPFKMSDRGPFGFVGWLMGGFEWGRPPVQRDCLGNPIPDMETINLLDQQTRPRELHYKDNALLRLFRSQRVLAKRLQWSPNAHQQVMFYETKASIRKGCFASIDILVELTAHLRAHAAGAPRDENLRASLSNIGRTYMARSGVHPSWWSDILANTVSFVYQWILSSEPSQKRGLVMTPDVRTRPYHRLISAAPGF